MKRKGFTLVELLGVIVVLAIIALIAVPTIIGVIDKSRKGSLKTSGYGLVEAGTLYNAQYQNEKTIRFDIQDNEVTSKEENKLTYKGFIKEGTVLVNNNGKVTVCINDGRYAAYKNFKDNKVIIVDNKTCNIPENSNIVYLDNEATIDTNIEDLVAEMNQMKQRIEEQDKKIKELEDTKSNQSEITNSINNLTSTHNADITLLNNRLGNTFIGNDTITGVISNLNNLVSNNKVVLTTTSSSPWVAIKEQWDSIPGNISTGYIHCAGPTFGFIFFKAGDSYGTGLIFGYQTKWVWHVYRDGNFYIETLSTSSEATQF